MAPSDGSHWLDGAVIVFTRQCCYSTCTPVILPRIVDARAHRQRPQIQRAVRRNNGLRLPRPRADEYASGSGQKDWIHGLNDPTKPNTLPKRFKFFQPAPPSALPNRANHSLNTLTTPKTSRGRVRQRQRAEGLNHAAGHEAVVRGDAVGHQGVRDREAQQRRRHRLQRHEQLRGEKGWRTRRRVGNVFSRLST